MYAGCGCLDEVAGSDSEPEEDVAFNEPDKVDLETLEWAASTQKRPSWANQRRSRRSSTDDAIVPRYGSDANAQFKKKRFAYHSRGAKTGLLRGPMLKDSRAPIYECHEGCRCSKDKCPNRIVERGRQVPLQIFRTEDKRGWGKCEWSTCLANRIQCTMVQLTDTAVSSCRCQDYAPTKARPVCRLLLWRSHHS